MVHLPAAELQLGVGRRRDRMDLRRRRRLVPAARGAGSRVSPVLRGCRARSGQAFGPTLPGCRARARRRTDLEWLPGADSARLALLSRGPANIPRTQGYEYYEGIIEAETWFGPLFTNIRLTRTNSPVEFHVRYPMFQVQPLLRQCYSGVAFEIVGLAEMSADDWKNFEATMKPNSDQMRVLGHYAAATRRRQRKGP